MIKPVGARCNLTCTYCYYLPKAELYPEWKGRPQVMSDAVLETAIRQYIESQPTQEVVFIWHGGEPTLAGLDFYRKVLRQQEQYAQGHMISNCLQTNGTILNDDWCHFLCDNEWLVGISVDGPEYLHDVNRGRGTHRRIMRSVELLKQYGVLWNAMAVVNKHNILEPEAFYDFFADNGCQYLQFTPEFLAGQEEDFPQQWGNFLCRVWDRWLDRGDLGQRFVQLFDAVLAGWMGIMPGVCTLGQHCGHALVMEHNGDVYQCDHFVDKDHLLGNVMQTHLATLANSQRQREFGLDKEMRLADSCRQCQWLQLCHGECPGNRKDNKCYLCAGYKLFFAHSADIMQQLRQEILTK